MEVVTSNREVREGFQKAAALEAFGFASMAVQAERLDLFSELTVSKWHSRTSGRAQFS